MGLSVKVINGIKAIKETDTLTDMQLRLIGLDGLPFDLTGKTVKVVLGNLAGKVLEKNAVLGRNKGELFFGFDPADVTGFGRLFLEVHIIQGVDRMIFPSEGYVPVQVKQNLNVPGAAAKEGR